jgi:hypothetical protein
MRTFRSLCWLPIALAISACVTDNKYNQTTTYLDRHATRNPTVAEFTVCHGFNCTEKKHVSLSAEQWRRVSATFAPRARTAQQERRQIARAVALVESYVGPQAGIAARQWTHQNMYVLPNLGDLTQIDCIDASVNTWTYMTLMERQGLFHFHKVANLSNAGSLVDPDVRNTAVLKENDGGYYAVDASLVDHGTPPLVMPLEVWLAAWPPDRKQIETADMLPAAGNQTSAARTRAHSASAEE